MTNIRAPTDFAKSFTGTLDNPIKHSVNIPIAIAKEVTTCLNASAFKSVAHAFATDLIEPRTSIAFVTFLIEFARTINTYINPPVPAKAIILPLFSDKVGINLFWIQSRTGLILF